MQGKGNPLYLHSGMIKRQCHSDNSCSIHAESLSVEEVLSNIQFLLRSEDSDTYGHIHLLLCCSACNCCDFWSTGSYMGSCLYSSNYSSECSWDDAEVSLYSAWRILIRLWPLPYTVTCFCRTIICRSFHLAIFWILFENVMSLHRTKGTFIGLLEAGRFNEWIVTEKLGRVLQTKSGSKVHKKPRFRMRDRYNSTSHKTIL